MELPTACAKYSISFMSVANAAMTRETSQCLMDTQSYQQASSELFIESKLGTRGRLSPSQEEEETEVF